MNNDHNTIFGLFKFQSGYRKLYLNSPKGYSRKIINVQTELRQFHLLMKSFIIEHLNNILLLL